ncbi:hypothetical protein ACFLXB_05130, partial [Chloroflexota bacterium]
MNPAMDGGFVELESSFDKVHPVFSSAQKKMHINAAIQSSLQVFLSGIGYWAVLIIGISLVSTGKIPGTNLAVIVLAAMASFETVQVLPQAAGHLESSLQAASRLFAFADTKP